MGGDVCPYPLNVDKLGSDMLRWLNQRIGGGWSPGPVLRDSYNSKCCIGYFSHHCDKIHDRSKLGKRFVLFQSLKGALHHDRGRHSGWTTIVHGSRAGREFVYILGNQEAKG